MAASIATVSMQRCGAACSTKPAGQVLVVPALR